MLSGMKPLREPFNPYLCCHVGSQGHSELTQSIHKVNQHRHRKWLGTGRKQADTCKYYCQQRYIACLKQDCSNSCALTMSYCILMMCNQYISCIKFINWHDQDSQKVHCCIHSNSDGMNVSKYQSVILLSFSVHSRSRPILTTTISTLVHTTKS